MQTKIKLIAFLCFMLIIKSNYIFSLNNTIYNNENNIIKDERFLKEFTNIINKSKCNIKVLFGDKFVAYVEADNSIQSSIVTIVDGKDLIITNDKKLKNYDSQLPITITIYLKYLESFTNTGSGEVEVNPIPKLDKIKINNNGSGNMVLKFDCEKLLFENEGSGTVNFDGKVNKIEAKIYGSGNIFFNLTNKADFIELVSKGSANATLKGLLLKGEFNNYGSGNIYANELQSDFLLISNKGSGSLNIWFDKEAKIDSYGSGDILYKGFGVIKEMVQKGSGRIIKQ